MSSIEAIETNEIKANVKKYFKLAHSSKSYGEKKKFTKHFKEFGKKK